MRVVPISKFVLDEKNANKGTKRGRELLEESLGKYGAGRSVVVDRNNRVIAGNKTVEAAVASGMKSISVIQTDGSSLVAVQRNDLDLKRDKKSRELAIADNRVGEIDLEWNTEVLASLDVDFERFWNENELKTLLKNRRSMDIYLIDGTYELFRYFYAVPSAKDFRGQEIGAVRGVLGSILSLIEGGATHVGVASDHVIESFRNDLYSGYKTSEGVDPALLSQFPILEEALQSMGVLVWPMIEFEADDALASAAAKAAQDDRVRQIIICTPDKDLSQCVVGSRVVQLDRQRKTLRDEAGVIGKFGIKPSSIPDYLAVVGDSADGYPGISGWGSKTAAVVFSQCPHLEDIPKDWRHWDPMLRRARPLAESLFGAWEDALLFRTLATLRVDVPVFSSIDDLLWRGAAEDFKQTCERMNAPDLFRRASARKARQTLQ
ncbi:MAG: 5'-3' exonuclease H3TH domain-containing protein [Candidatus Acidiferrales bacterium]